MFSSTNNINKILRSSVSWLNFVLYPEVWNPFIYKLQKLSISSRKTTSRNFDGLLEKRLGKGGHTFPRSSSTICWLQKCGKRNFWTKHSHFVNLKWNAWGCGGLLKPFAGIFKFDYRHTLGVLVQSRLMPYISSVDKLTPVPLPAVTNHKNLTPLFVFLAATLKFVSVWCFIEESSFFILNYDRSKIFNFDLNVFRV